jgi:hypothetical protein
MINHFYSKPTNIRSVEDIASYFRSFLKGCMTSNGYPPSLEEAYVLQLWDQYGKNVIKKILDYAENNTDEIHRAMVGFIHQFIGDPVTCQGGWFSRNLNHSNYYEHFKHNYEMVWCYEVKEPFVRYLTTDEEDEEDDDIWIKMCEKMSIN